MQPLDRLSVGSITAPQLADVLRPIWRGPSTGQGARLRQLMGAYSEPRRSRPIPPVGMRCKTSYRERRSRPWRTPVSATRSCLRSWWTSQTRRLVHARRVPGDRPRCRPPTTARRRDARPFLLLVYSSLAKITEANVLFCSQTRNCLGRATGQARTDCVQKSFCTADQRFSGL
jgi:hypothetical protein